MKIAVAQTRPKKGNIEANIAAHVNLIQQAAALGTGIIIFPELSITGYEPTLAAQLATTINDDRLTVFEQLSNTHQLTIGVGMPLATAAMPVIGMAIFKPGGARQVYAKKYLHADELPFFASGQSTVTSLGEHNEIALAICYEISVDEHTQQAFSTKPLVYVASVAKAVKGIKSALQRLAFIAQTHNALVLMANCTGFCDGEECAGQSSVFNTAGQLTGQLNNTEEGLLIVDTKTHTVIQTVLQQL